MSSYQPCCHASHAGGRAGAKRLLSALFYGMTLRCSGRPKTPVDKDTVAVLSFGALGDLIVFCDAARRLKKAGKRLTLFCKTGNGTAEFARYTGLFQQVVELDLRGLHRLTALRRLRAMAFDTVFGAPLGRHILPDLCACLIQANHRYFPDTLQDCSLPRLKKRADRFADKLVPLTETLELKRYTAFFRACGLLAEEILPFRLDLPPLERDRTLAVFPGAGGGEGKKWPADRFAEAALRLVESGAADRVALLGSSGDAAACAALYDALSGRCDVENRCGQTDIAALAELLRRCGLTLANDSGSAHLSIACGAPTVVICGMWQPGRFYPDPYLDGSAVSAAAAGGFGQTCRYSVPRCSLTPAPCVGAVTVEQVVRAALELQQQTRKDCDHE